MSAGLQSTIAALLAPLTIWACICLSRIGRARLIEAEARLQEAKNAASTDPHRPETP